MEFNWLSEDRKLAKKIVMIKDIVFAQDMLSGYENDMFDAMITRGFDNVAYHNTYYKRWNEAVIVEEGKEVGIIGYYAKDNKNYWINWYGILPEFRGHGYGSKAIKELELWLKEARNAKCLRLYTGEFNNKTAFEMYKKLGYIPQKERFKNRNEEDIVIMGKTLDGSQYQFWKGEPFW